MSLILEDALETLRQEIANHLAVESHRIWSGAGYVAPEAIAKAIRDGEVVELTATMDAVEDLINGLSSRYLEKQRNQSRRPGHP